MLDNPRTFEATDPFGRKWTANLRWLQNAISIRHADAVDVKWELTSSDGTTMDKVIALNHPLILALTAKSGRTLTDSFCIRIAAAHLRVIIETWEDAEKIIVTPTAEQLAAASALTEQVLTEAK